MKQVATIWIVGLAVALVFVVGFELVWWLW